MSDSFISDNGNSNELTATASNNQLLPDPRFLDPSTADGSNCIFDREISIEVRRFDQADATIGNVLPVKVKILVNGPSDSPESVRVELSMEDDLFFAMYHQLHLSGFSILVGRQKLMIEFKEYAQTLINNFTKSIRDPQNCMCILYLNSEGNGRCDFVVNMGVKFVELLSIDFLQTPQDILKQQIIFRYFALKHSVSVLQSRLADVSELVRQKSPSLLLQIKRTPLRNSTNPNSNNNNAKSPVGASQSLSQQLALTNTSNNSFSNSSKYNSPATKRR